MDGNQFGNLLWAAGTGTGLGVRLRGGRQGEIPHALLGSHFMLIKTDSYTAMCVLLHFYTRRPMCFRSEMMAPGKGPLANRGHCT